MDGGTDYNTNIVSAVEKCKKQGFKNEDIILDVLVCGYNSKNKTKDISNAFDNHLRFKDIKQYYQGEEDVLEMMHAYPGLNFRYYVKPS